MKAIVGLSVSSLVIAGLIIVAPACGKRGPPLPPLRPAPVAVGDLSVTRRADSVTVRFTPPRTNQDGSEPLLLDHIDIYAMTLAPDAAPPFAEALRVEANRVARLTPADPAAAMAFTDTVPASASIRYYQVVPYANRTRAGAASPLVTVPLETTPAPPQDAAVTYDEQTLTLTWTAVASAPGYFVYRVGAPTTKDAPLHAARLTTTKFAQPVVFGERACFVVRSVQGTAPLAVESAPSAEACVTPADTFPPPAPSGLVALASPGSINLSWDAVTAADLAGYLVLRGEGSGDRLQPLMTSPVTGTSFNDDTAKAGVRYFYAVVAVDKAVPANRSKESNRV
ncbi:MAG: fibronectin type III domain-containing protein, partial [Acidobacteria bacterium]